MKIKYNLQLLKKEEIWGKNQLKAIKNYRLNCAITDLAIITGCNYNYDPYYNLGDELADRTGCIWTSSPTLLTSEHDSVHTVDEKGVNSLSVCYSRFGLAIRPVICSKEAFEKILPYKITSSLKATPLIEYGEFPQMVPHIDLQKELNKQYNKGTLKELNKTFSINGTDKYNGSFEKKEVPVYCLGTKQYINTSVCKNAVTKDGVKLSNNHIYKNGDNVWIEVSPVKWLIENEKKKLISLKGLISGIRISDIKIPFDDFNKSEMKTYMDECMEKEMFSNKIKSHSL